MDIKTYNELKNHELDIFRSETIYVTPITLFRRKSYKGLTMGEKCSKALSEGWRWDLMKAKYYKERECL